LTTGSAPKSVLSWRNISSLALTTIHDFSGLGLANMEIGDAEGNLSNDDVWLVLQGDVSSAQKVLVYNMVTDSVSSLFACTTRPNNATVSQSGNYVIIQFSGSGSGAQQGIQCYDRATFGTGATALRQIDTNGGGHWDCGYDTDGNEVAVVSVSGAVKTVRLSDGTVRTEIPSTNAFTGYGHISCRNIARPGYSYHSVLDSVGASGLKGNDQVLALKLDGTGTVEVFCFSHHGAEWYNNSPFAVPSPDGKLVVFGSEWGADDTVDNAYCFVTGLAA
jgi:hypothetical protein